MINPLMKPFERMNKRKFIKTDQYEKDWDWYGQLIDDRKDSEQWALPRRIREMRRLALAACRGAEAAAFVPADRDAPACAFALPFLRWLESEGFTLAADSSVPEGPFEKLGRRLFGAGGPAPLTEATLQVVSAPAASREAFELCRELSGTSSSVAWNAGQQFARSAASAWRAGSTLIGSMA